MEKTKKGRGLGRGLNALFEGTSFDTDIKEDSLKNGEEVQTLKIRDIEPNKNQPRKNFDSEKLASLAESL